MQDRLVQAIKEAYRSNQNDSFRMLLAAGIVFTAVVVWSVAHYGLEIPNQLIQEKILEAFPLILGLAASVAMTAIAFSNSREIASSKKVSATLLEEFVIKQTHGVEDLLVASRARMLLDAERLQRNSSKNLTLGIIFSILALAFLTWFVYSYNEASLPSEGRYEFFFRWLLPRLAIVFLLQFVAFFFLRLCVVSEADIKHNKNEITNIEAKAIAYYMLKGGSDPTLKILITELAKTERNFIIKKSEKTASFEAENKDAFKNELIEKLIDKLPNVRANTEAT